jgi:putative FmdB family regulatory protein
MPVYTYRREDGTTFDYRQKFSDEPLASDPATGQRVTRVVQAAGVIFKGSGFYVTDTKGAAKSAAPTNGTSTSTDSDTKTETKTEAPKTETVKTEAAAD